MKIIKFSVIPVIFFLLTLIAARAFGVNNAYFDWAALIAFTLYPLVFIAKAGLNKLALAALLLVNPAIMFTLAFYVLAMFYGEGL